MSRLDHLEPWIWRAKSMCNVSGLYVTNIERSIAKICKIHFASGLVQAIVSDSLACGITVDKWKRTTPSASFTCQLEEL